MDKELFLQAADNIADELIDEAAGYRRKSKTPLYLSLAGAAAAIVLLSQAFIVTGRDGRVYFDPSLIFADRSKLSGELTGAGADGLSDKDTGAAPNGGDGLVYGGAFDEGELNATPVTVTGSEITRAESDVLFEANGKQIYDLLVSDIDSLLPLIDADVENVGFRVSAAGYGHVKTTDANENVLDLDFRTYPIFFGERVVASIELYRYGGELHWQFGYAGPSFQSLTALFSEYAEDPAAFVYCGGLELAVTPDNKVYDIRGGKEYADAPAGIDLYSVYAAGYNTYNAAKVLEGGEYMTLGKKNGVFCINGEEQECSRWLTEDGEDAYYIGEDGYNAVGTYKIGEEWYIFDGVGRFTGTSFKVTGELITEDEIRGLIGREGANIAALAALETKGLTGDISIALRGYCTLNTEDNTLAADYLTLPIFSDGRIIGSVVLFRYDGETHYSVLAGGDGWDSINRALSESPYGNIAFVASGQYNSRMILPDDKVFGYESECAGEAGLFRRYSSSFNTLSFNEMMIDKAYVTIPRDTYAGRITLR